ncbi:GNAT family N-acetyltransferase [Marinilabiliaceae bacterium ANBcel2]|nr:GNAT family N-acetyltransferase [Marinilabiliaceae bacterium ANBcel2]
MIDSFPENERRMREEYIKTMKNRAFSTTLFCSETADIKGFLSYWKLSDFIFVEHFAISSKFRNQGLGNKLFSQFLNSISKPVVLEVEPPTDSISKRRVNFYERMNFVLNRFDYYQPSYHNDNKKVPLLLMTSNGTLSSSQFKMLQNDIYNIVYNI